MRSDYSSQELLDRRLLQVPDYQRGYAWERAQLEDFWDDLTVLPQGVDHYFGTVVLLPHGRDHRLQDDAGVWYEVVDIVDGQQRLTTLILLLNELRRRFAATGMDPPARAIAERFVWIRRGGIDVPRLRLGRDIDQFWRDCVLPDEPVLRPPQLRSEERLIEARDFFRDRVGAIASSSPSSDAGDAQSLLTMRDIATDRLRFTLYEVVEPFRVGVIFETLNDRGRGLTELERTKNYLLFLTAALPEEPRGALTERTNAAWSHVHQRLMAARIVDPVQEDRFLRAHWLMSVDPAPRNWSGAESVKARFPRDVYWQADHHQQLVDDVSAYIAELEGAARAFCDVRQPYADDAFAEFANRDEVQAVSAKLLRAGGVASFTPLLMAVRLRFRGDGGLYQQVVRRCECFAFRAYRLRGLRVNTGQGRLYRLAHRVFHGEADAQEVLDTLTAATTSWCPRARFEREFAAEADERNWFAWSGLRYFLYECEEHLAGRRQIRKSWSEVAQQPLEETVEHVLPQSPRDGEWPAFADDDRRRLTNDLGNLVLTFDNSAYANKAFAEKRGPRERPDGSAAPCYAHSPLLQEQEIARFDDWIPESVRQRRQRLIDWARQRWAVPGDEERAVDEALGDAEPDDVDPEEDNEL